MAFLPIVSNGKEVDFVLISADAYVDHPSFGHAIISRIIEDNGFSIGIIPQPQEDIDYKEFGRPKIAFLISGGVVDSMVNNYSVALNKRNRDDYSEGGIAGKRPDRVINCYSNKLRSIYGDTPIIIGGIEASLRRFAHYDYWENRVLPSILVDSKADLLIYGMGEKPLFEILDLVSRGVPIKDIKDIRGTAYLSNYNNLSEKVKELFNSPNANYCPSYDEVKNNKISYAKAFNSQCNTSMLTIQKHDKDYVVVNPISKALTQEEMDYVYDLPYERNYHPMYLKGVPAIEEVKFSITSHRGCFGGCSYCALTYHQGKIISKRSKESIIREANILINMPDFKGYIHDIGGPTANFRNNACKENADTCKKKNCIGNKPCKNLRVNHDEYLDILRAVRGLDGIKKVFIRSGIRFDYVMYDKDDKFLQEIIEHHISGQLKVAPEHSSDKVLKLMNKPSFNVYLEFREKFMKMTKSAGKEQYIVPYFISSHPGSTLNDAIDLAVYLKSIRYMPEQVQDFYPTPSTKSTTMYHTEINPDNMEDVYVAKTKKEKHMQRALLQYRFHRNYSIILEALKISGRQDLIGASPKCLIQDVQQKKILNPKGK